jgi:hypothetical protein
MRQPPWSDTAIGDNARFDIADEARLADAVSHLLRQTRYSLQVYTPDLEPRLYDTADVAAALRRTATASRRADIRLLARDLDPAIKAGHRLIELARKLSSFIEIRLAPTRGELGGDAFVIADRSAVLYRPHAGRPEGELHLHDPRQARLLAGRFQILWDEATTSPDLRRLHL